MKERLNVSIQSASLILVAAGLAWVVWSNDTSMKEMLTYLLLLVVFIEALSLFLVGSLYPESHRTFKLGMIAAMVILLGVRIMFPPVFIPATVLVFAINFSYNFYTNGKRKSSSFRRKALKKKR
jgi:hypothetical protein